MAKGTARKRREIRQLKEHFAYGAIAEEQPCVECGGTAQHSTWCLAEEDDHEDGDI